MKWIRFGGLILALTALTGCAGLQASLGSLGGPKLAANGQTVDQYALRMGLAAGHADSVLTDLTEEERGTPDDDLLAGLYVGLAASYAGDYETSNAALQAAADLADDRYTESVSEGAASILTNDNALGYEPGQTERMFIHYYGMMNYLEMDDPVGAAVEARRVGALLERFDEDQDSVDVATRAMMRYVSGAAFEVAGQRNDAGVAYRNAFALVGEDEGRLPAVAEPGDDEGTLVVAIEHGFVAHRVPNSLKMALTKGEAGAFGGENVAEKLAVAGIIAARVATTMNRQPGQGLYWDAEDTEMVVGNLGRAAYVLSVAWPTFRRPVNRPFAATLNVEGVQVAARPAADVSDAILGDFQRARTGILTRTIARAGVKMFAAEQVRKEFGFIAGLAANVAGGLLESADVRSWQMLPGEVGFVRVNLPAGTYPAGHLTVAVPGPGGTTRALDLGETVIEPGEVAVRRVRTY